jgi:hypothetical protein
MSISVLPDSAAEFGSALGLLAGAVAFEVAFVERERQVPYWGGLLVVAALVYVGFVHRAGTMDEGWLLIEWGGVATFAVLAVLAGRLQSRWAMALAWGLHPLWDVLLHASAKDSSLVSLQVVDKPADHTPWFYPGACIVFDLAAALWLIASPGLLNSAKTKPA